MSFAGQHTLAHRVANALRSKVSSDGIVSLIEEVERAGTVADEGCRAARARALDPTADAEQASAARREEAALRFEQERFATALEALQAAYGKAITSETNASRQAAFDAAEAERDALVEELRREYPEIERRLSNLMQRLAASDEAVVRVNGDLPGGVRGLVRAEEVARGGRERFSSYQEYLSFRLADQLRLPRFQIEPLDPNAWPPKGVR